MSRKHKTETNVVSASRELTYARHRGKSLKKGARREVRNGLLIDNSIRNGRRRTRVLDFPHYLVFKAASTWPGTGLEAPAVDRYVRVASSRDAFVSGAGASPLDLDDISPSPEDDKGLFRSARIVSFAPVPPGLSMAGGTGVARVARDSRSIAMANLYSDGGAWEGLPGTIVYMPMSPSRPLGVEVSVSGHRQYRVRANVTEALIRGWIGGGSLVRRQYPPPPVGSDVYLYVFVPDVSVDFGPWGFKIAVPVTWASDDPRDHGEKFLFFLGVAADPDTGEPVEGDNTIATAVLPDVPQLAQSEWVQEVGLAPSFIWGEVIQQPSGRGVYYGVYLGGVLPDDAGLDREVAFLSTIFAIDEGGVTDIIRCTGSAPWLAGREIARSDPQYHPVYSQPAAFRAAGSNWLVLHAWFGTGRLTNLSNGVGTNQEYGAITIVRDSAVVAEGLPPGGQIVTGSGWVYIGRGQVGVSTSRNELVACHLNTADHFGFTFVMLMGFSVRLGRWDTLNGFGVWDLDYSELDAGPQGQASITCYRRVSIDEEGEQVGEPGFVVCMDAGGVAATYIVTGGKATYCSPAFAAAAFPVGNDLTSQGNTEEAYGYPNPED